MENQEQVIARVWVHPTDGVDPNPPSTPPESQYIDDPSLKFKSLQAAIDALERHLATNYNATSNPAEQGVVYAMPGLYGPHGASTSSNDSLPILMRDRVHVIGVGARRCVIRGASTLALPAPNAPALYWPVNFAAPHASQSAEVLVDFQRSTPDAPVPPTLNIPAPWLQTGPFSESNNVAEVLDGFSFQGGDVQVLLMSHALQPALWPSSRISNCVFDMRHGWAVSGSAAPPQAQLAGPYFGIMMQRRSIAQTSGVVGYLDGSTLVAHNSFIFAEWGDSATNQGWAWESRLEAVGIIDVTNPVFSTGQYDPYTLPRGVGNPCIVGNLFRTRPEFLSNPPPSPLPPKPFAMLGISLDDTLVWNGQSFVQTNAFDPARVGSTNGNGSSGSGFNARPTASMRVETGAANSFNDLWNCSTYTQTQQPPNCSAAAAPTPAVAIWDGSSGFDPAFVGEYLATVQSGAYPYLVGYRDWRLLPSSPLENLGVTPPLGGPRAYQTQFSAQTGGWVFQLAANTDVDMLQWDGEHWGNPRVVDGAPDIGFDERHLLICAGSWSNDSNSHNAAGFMHPVAAGGGSTRFLILPATVTTAGGTIQVFGANRTLVVHQASLTPTGQSAGNGWINPPVSLNPPPASGLPLGYRSKYVAFGGPPAPWSFDLATIGPNTYFPLGLLTQAPLIFVLQALVDDECSQLPCAHDYFNMQGVLQETSSGTALLRSNMQGEYR